MQCKSETKTRICMDFIFFGEFESIQMPNKSVQILFYIQMHNNLSLFHVRMPMVLKWINSIVHTKYFLLTTIFKNIFFVASNESTDFQAYSFILDSFSFSLQANKENLFFFILPEIEIAFSFDQLLCECVTIFMYHKMKFQFVSLIFFLN